MTYSKSKQGLTIEAVHSGVDVSEFTIFWEQLCGRVNVLVWYKSAWCLLITGLLKLCLVGLPDFGT